MMILLFILISSSYAEMSLTQKDAVNLFNQHCSNGRQLKSLSESFVAKIQVDNAGLAIDEAQEQILKKKDAARKLAKQLYITYYGQDCSASSNTYELEELSRGIDFYSGQKKIKLSWYDLPSLKVFWELERFYTLRMPIEQQKKLFSNSSVRGEYFRPKCSEFDS